MRGRVHMLGEAGSRVARLEVLVAKLGNVNNLMFIAANQSTHIHRRILLIQLRGCGLLGLGLRLVLVVLWRSSQILSLIIPDSSKRSK